MALKVHQKRTTFCNEPYYPPGYCGYSPQFPFQFGDTYGMTTSRLLTDPSVAKSGRLVLADMFPKEDDSLVKGPDKNEWKRIRKQSWGDKKLNDRMVPGYTGYIPKQENHFGTRYAENCQNAITDFANDQNIHKERKRLTPAPPQRAIRLEPKPYVSLNQAQHSVSPYFMNVHDPDKTFMSGYTGFIPRARGRFAMDYPNLTREALVDFTKRQQHLKLLDNQPVLNPSTSASIRRAPGSEKQRIYVNGGLLPHYTGYLPGHKFRFGDTFGTSSRYFHATNSRERNVVRH